MVGGELIYGKHPYFAYKEAVDDIKKTLSEKWAEVQKIKKTTTELFKRRDKKLENIDSDAKIQEAKVLKNEEKLDPKSQYTRIQAIYKLALDETTKVLQQARDIKAKKDTEKEELLAEIEDYEKQKDKLTANYLQDKQDFNDHRYPPKTHKTHPLRDSMKTKVADDEIPW